MTQLSLELKPRLGLYDDPQLIDHYQQVLFCWKQPGTSFHDEVLMRNGGPAGSVVAEASDRIRIEMFGDGFDMTIPQARDLALRLNGAIWDAENMGVIERQRRNRRTAKQEA